MIGATTRSSLSASNRARKRSQAIVIALVVVSRWLAPRPTRGREETRTAGQTELVSSRRSSSSVPKKRCSSPVRSAVNDDGLSLGRKKRLAWRYQSAGALRKWSISACILRAYSMNARRLRNTVSEVTFSGTSG